MASVTGPILPIYMSRMMISFPPSLKRGVNPMLSPTVPRAEKASKTISTMVLRARGSGGPLLSVTAMSRAARLTAITQKKLIPIALVTICSGMPRSKMRTCSFERSRVKKEAMMMARSWS